MFILRTIWASTGAESNQILGDRYEIVERNHKEFLQYCKDHLGEPPNKSTDATKAFVVCGQVFPIYYSDYASYYIMTESGKTFTKL